MLFSMDTFRAEDPDLETKMNKIEEYKSHIATYL